MLRKSHLLDVYEALGGGGGGGSQVALVIKNLPASAGDIRDAGLIHSNPYQHSFLENPMDRGVW